MEAVWWTQASYLLDLELNMKIFQKNDEPFPGQLDPYIKLSAHNEYF